MNYINTIIEVFGGRIQLSVLFMFFLVLFLMANFIQRKIWLIPFAIIGALYVVLELVSLFFNQTFISYSFLVHFNLRGIKGESWLFLPHFVAGFVLWIIGVILVLKSKSILRFVFTLFRLPQKLQLKTSIGILMVFLISTLYVSMKSTYWEDKQTLVSILRAPDGNFEKALEDVGITNYTLPDQIEATQGQNIIVLSLESVEMGFLHEKFAHLTPNLNRLRDEWHFKPMQPTKGSGWTSASLYTCLTGFPAFFGRRAYNLFKDVYATQISSITMALNKAGYYSTYLSGDTDHAGIIDILNAFQFDKVVDYKNVASSGHESFYGLRDKELFEHALNEIKRLNDKGSAFAVFVSTIDTHFPNGIYDKRFEKILPSQNSELEFMVSVVDYLIGEFIASLEEEGLLDNTVIYIFPDHLKMGDPSVFENTGERLLYVLSNKKIQSPKDTLTQIDLAPAILNGASIKHNLRFLTDYITGNVNDFIGEHIAELTTVNTSGTQKLEAAPIVFEDTHEVSEYEGETPRFIAHAGGMIQGHIYTNSLEALDSSYQLGFRYFELDIQKTSDNQYIALHDWEIWQQMTGATIKPPVSLKNFQSHSFYKQLTPLDLKGINKWFVDHPDAWLVTDKINDPVRFSTEFAAPERLLMELHNKDSLSAALAKNMNHFMLAESIVLNADDTTLRGFYQKGIRYAVVSRSFIHEHPAKLSTLKSLGYKIYIHNPEKVSEINTEFMIKYELHHVYGLYTDVWPF